MLLAPVVTLAGVLSYLDDGYRGMLQTIRVMRDLVRRYRVHPDIRRAATSVLFLTPEREGSTRARALYEWVRDHVRYVPDVLDVETLTTPDKVLQTLIGDCDDQATLLATLYESVGFPTRFVVAGYTEPGIYEHVFLQVLSSGVWFDADPTEHEAFGWSPPFPVSTFIEGV
jgi:transglutaminase-like putative cysteine protease